MGESTFGGAMRAILALFAALVLIGCGGRAPTSPTPSPTPGVTPPRLTVSVSGLVYDTVSRPVPAARVEVINGTQVGSAVITNESGEFTFETPLEIQTQLRASKAGYRTETKPVLSGPGPVNPVRVVFQLGSVNPPVDVTGQYEIAFTADAACEALPGIARTRAYSATVTSTNISLSGALFGAFGDSLPWNSIYLQQFGDIARFSMYDPPILEVIANAPPPVPAPFYPRNGDSYISISGEASGTIGREHSQVALLGSFEYCPKVEYGASRQCAVDVVTCRSAQHQMTMTRR
jgi:carboxypeptidase family protein